MKFFKTMLRGIGYIVGVLLGIYLLVRAIFRAIYKTIFHEKEVESHLGSLTWKCEICGEDRPDRDISVMTYQIKDFPGAHRNLKYCNDREACHEMASTRAREGKM